MKVVFPNSAWVTALERLVLARGRLKSVRLQVRYGVVIHPIHGPVLIDTGYTDHTVTADGRSAVLRLYSRILAPAINTAEQPDAVLKRLGYAVSDVKFVIVTHFHADHVSGLKAFPNARFVVDEMACAKVLNGGALANLRHGVFTELLPHDFDTRTMSIQQCRKTSSGYDIFGDGSLVAMSLPGHAAGHFGVWIDAKPRPILYAVDTQWMRAASVENRSVGYPARLIMDDFVAFKRSSDAVSDIITKGHDVVFCHDPERTAFDWDGT